VPEEGQGYVRIPFYGRPLPWISGGWGALCSCIPGSGSLGGHPELGVPFAGSHMIQQQDPGRGLCAELQRTILPREGRQLGWP
jgi:hypothetical protein